MLRTLTLGLGLLLLPLAGCEELPTGPDTTPPTITLISPSAGSSATDTIVVQVNATDDRGIAMVELFFDTLNAPAAQALVSPYKLVGSLADLGSGSHTFRVMATDSAGNSASVGPIAFTATVTPGLKFIGRLLVDGSARDVDVSGDFAYVATWDGGVTVVDISNPQVPKFVTRFDTDGNTNGVTVSGDRLFVADGDQGVRALSIAPPYDTPMELAQVKPAGMNAYDVAVTGNLAFVAGGTGGLYALNILNPDTLIVLGFYDQGGDVRDVEISGNYAFTADMNDGMRVIDVTRPDSMFAVDQYVSTGLVIYDVSLVPGYAFAAAGNDGVQAIDVADPINISVVDFYNSSDLVQGVVTSGTLAYFSQSTSGVQVIDATDPANLLALTGGVFDTDGLAYKLAISSGYLLVADNAQLTILKYVAP